MRTLTDLEYLKLTRLQRFWYKICMFFCSIPKFFVNCGKGIWKGIQKLGTGIANECKDVVQTFVKGDWKTRASFLVMGFGSIARGQILRGLLFLLFEAVFIFYMIASGAKWLSLFGTLGTVEQGRVYDEVKDVYVTVEGDNSFKILLYGILTIIFCIAFIYTWRLNVKQNKIGQELQEQGKRLKSAKDDLRSLVDEEFHKTLLALPLTGILIFTVLPIIFMILVAFTSYDGVNNGYSKLFTWIGLDNFNALITLADSSGNSLSYTFGEVLTWTLMWAFFATFTNYFLGMLVALAINKKGIKLKKMWRGILVLTMAVPQFISLLYISHMFDKTGVVNNVLMNLGWITSRIDFWADGGTARLLVILINIWVGIPYLMLIITGVLMNIPQDLYESAKIDGANAFQQYRKITLPYVLFVTGPYLLTSFTGNINNFNVIYLLTGSVKANPTLTVNGQFVKSTDLLITWLFNLTTGATSNYKLACTIGIFIFFVIAIISLIVYNILPSNKNEEDFS